MPRVKVTVPAASVGLGPGIESVGLALSLHNTIEMSLRPDSVSTISVRGESAEAFPLDSTHPVFKALKHNEALAGIGVNVVCTSEIPANCGLADEAAWIVGGLVAITNLVPSSSPLNRNLLLTQAAKLVTQAPTAITSILGGLTATSTNETPEKAIYRRLEVAPMQVVIAVPSLPDYQQQISKLKEKKVEFKDALFNISRVPLMIEALRKNDMALLGETMEDRLVEIAHKALIPGYDTVFMAAKNAGAAAITLSGNGPALIAFAAKQHSAIEAAIQTAFAQSNVRARTWIVNVDTQGISINFQQ